MRTVIILNSTRAVVKAERLLKEKSIVCRIIPLPKEISSECGMALEIEPKIQGMVIGILHDAYLEAYFTDLE